MADKKLCEKNKKSCFKIVESFQILTDFNVFFLIKAYSISKKLIWFLNFLVRFFFQSGRYKMASKREEITESIYNVNLICTKLSIHISNVAD